MCLVSPNPNNPRFKSNHSTVSFILSDKMLTLLVKLLINVFARADVIAQNKGNVKRNLSVGTEGQLIFPVYIC